MGTSKFKHKPLEDLTEEQPRTFAGSVCLLDFEVHVLQVRQVRLTSTTGGHWNLSCLKLDTHAQVFKMKGGVTFTVVDVAPK